MNINGPLFTKSFLGFAAGLLLFSVSTANVLLAQDSLRPVNGHEPESSGQHPQVRWNKLTTIEDLYSAYPERLDFIFEQLELERDGLQPVKEAFEDGNVVKAARHLLDYYKNQNPGKLASREAPPISNKKVPAADSIVQDIITIQGISDRIPRLENGHLDWSHTGPENDREFAWLHNRHPAVGILLQAWLDTGNPVYARHVDNYIQDWIISSWPYPGVKSSTAMWRGLEVSFRVKQWARAFYQLADTDYLTPATRLLILSSIPEHAHYARNFHAQGNWLTMEISGLATAAAYWPEFRESSEWLEYSIDTMTQSMKGQVYPDGVQTELTSSYHHVALYNFELFRNICELTNVSLPESYTATLEDMWNYLAATMRPSGYGLLNNDTDRRYNRDLIQEAAKIYNREDWQYIASNGSSGVEPDAGPSFVFPWAGHLISRSDYGLDAHWSFFDVGPWGSGHQHNDKLHLSVSAYGRDLLVDAGRFAYQGGVAERFRKYALNSQSHNVILIDGKGQGPGPKVTDEPLSDNSYRITEEFDYASASFDNFTDLDGEARHIRSLFYARGKFWIVADHIETDRPREIQALWHWHPESIVEEKDHAVAATNNDRGNLAIIPVGQDWEVDFVKGQDYPDVQGWYSREYNIFEASTAAIYTARIPSSATFVWVLIPSEGALPDVEVEVLSRDVKAVSVRVAVPGEGYWDVTVPFLNASDADMDFVSE